MRVTISILTYTALRQVKACLASVLQSKQPYKLILTANGNPEVAAYFQHFAAEFPNVRVIVNPNNEGFIEPNKQALHLCDTELFVMLNDDTVVPPDWLDKLIEPFDLYKTAALSGPVGGCQTLQPTFHGMKGRDFEYLEGSCLCCKTEVMKKHGLFDPHLRWAYGEDSDLSLRMRCLGYTLHQVSFPIRHEIAATSRFVKDVRLHQAANHAYLIKRWGHYLRVRSFGYPIIVKRQAAHGDVLLTTPIVRRLKELNPLSEVYVETMTAGIYANNPHVKRAQSRAPVLPNALVIDLNNAYESHPDRPILESYAIKAGLEMPLSSPELFLADADRATAARLMPECDFSWVVVHGGPNNWKSKEWPNGRWAELVRRLNAAGLKTVLVGSPGMDFGATLDLRGRTTIQEMAAVIERAKLFVGLDSLPLHCAEAVGTPTVGLFGVTDPKYILSHPERAHPVCATVPSFGLRHRVKNSTSVDDGGAAMQSITVEMVCAAIDSFAIPFATPCLATS